LTGDPNTDAIDENSTKSQRQIRGELVQVPRAGDLRRHHRFERGQLCSPITPSSRTPAA
jgi:hypothetical protein